MKFIMAYTDEGYPAYWLHVDLIAYIDATPSKRMTDLTRGDYHLVHVRHGNLGTRAPDLYLKKAELEYLLEAVNHGDRDSA